MYNILYVAKYPVRQVQYVTACILAIFCIGEKLFGLID